MIRWSQNAAASELVTRLGTARINRTAHRNGMPGFALASPWGLSPITAREETRFMLHIDRRLPPRHRAYGMRLLRTVVQTQRGGIAEVAPPGWTLYFKSWLGERARPRRAPGCAAAPRPGAGLGGDPHDGPGQPRLRDPDAARDRVAAPASGFRLIGLAQSRNPGQGYAA